MLYACVKRFDVIGGRENILGWDGEVNKAKAVHGFEIGITAPGRKKSDVYLYYHHTRPAGQNNVDSGPATIVRHSSFSH
jgi:hypothetical protein